MNATKMDCLGPSKSACWKALLSLTTLLWLTLGCASQRQFTSQPLQQPTLTYAQQGPNRLLSDCPEQFGVQIMAIRLTPQYTILEMQFTNRNQPLPTRYGQYVPQQGIWINRRTYLTSLQSQHRFKLLKAEGVPLGPKRLKIPPFEQARFTLYFERVDPGLEWLNWGKLGGYQRNYFEFVDLHIDNSTTPQQPLSSRSVTATQRLGDSLLVDHPIPLKAVYFEPGRATLLESSFEELNQLRDWLQQHPQCRIRFEGHTDQVGNHEQNQRLSYERAVACQGYLLSQGVWPARIEAVGYGDQQPLSRSKRETARQRNRRVEVRLLAP